MFECLLVLSALSLIYAGRQIYLEQKYDQTKSGYYFYRADLPPMTLDEIERFENPPTQYPPLPPQ